MNKFFHTGDGNANLRNALNKRLCCIAVGSLLALPALAAADCQQQLQQLSVDLRGMPLTETQKQTIGGMVDDARRYCWAHREVPAMEIIVKARQTAGIKPMGEEFRWETVPLNRLSGASAAPRGARGEGRGARGEGRGARGRDWISLTIWFTLLLTLKSLGGNLRP